VVRGEALPKAAYGVAHLISMKITQDVRDYAAKTNAGASARPGVRWRR
jgi:hypothetical protein